MASDITLSNQTETNLIRLQNTTMQTDILPVSENHERCKWHFVWKLIISNESSWWALSTAKRPHVTSKSIHLLIKNQKTLHWTCWTIYGWKDLSALIIPKKGIIQILQQMSTYCLLSRFLCSCLWSFNIFDYM